MNDSAYEVVGDIQAGGPFVFTCEHATRNLPEWKEEDAEREILADHWGWDIGAGDLTRDLVRRTGSCGVLSRFSRLICDPNRYPEDETFIVRAVDGRSLSFNRDVDEAEHQRRKDLYFDPYHDAIDRTVRERIQLGTPVRLCSIHSFTPVFLGKVRPMEIGVLFDIHHEAAFRLEGALAEQGFEVALNEPYSAKDGLAYAAERHGKGNDIVYLELEVRQDLIDTEAKASAVGERIARALEWFAPPVDEAR